MDFLLLLPSAVLRMPHMHASVIMLAIRRIGSLNLIYSFFLASSVFRLITLMYMYRSSLLILIDEIIE